MTTSTLTFQVIGRPQKPNGRLGARKSKTGCITCKSRKVKCDEAKPLCKRCSVGGHQCGGYADVFVTTKTVDSSPEGTYLEIIPYNFADREISPFVLGDPESRAFEYYTVKIASHLGGAVDSSFWDGPVLQLSHTEPAVRHALIAVSNMCETFESTEGFNVTKFEPVGLEAYSKALTATSDRISHGDGDIVAMTTCVLFLCIEFLQGNEAKAMKLLLRGSDILKRCLDGSNGNRLRQQPIVQNVILPLYERLIVLSALFGVSVTSFPRQWTSIYDAIDSGAFVFQTITNARDILYWLMIDAHAYIKKTRDYRYGRNLTEDQIRSLQAEHRRLMTAYQAWVGGFDAWSRKTERTLAEKSKEAALRMYHAITDVWLACAMEREETAYDRHIETFRVVVCEAKKIVKSSAIARGIEEHFSFEMGVIPPLYFTAIKCRDTRLRKEAILLLQNAPRREGLWTRGVTGTVAQRVVDIESDFHVQTKGRISDTQPDKPCRVADVFIHGWTNEGTSLTMFAKLDGHAELYASWDELVPA